MALIKKPAQFVDSPHEYLGLTTDMTDVDASAVPTWSTFHMHNGSTFVGLYVSDGSTWLWKE